MRAEQNPQLMNGRLVRVTKTATPCPQTGQGAIPNSGIAGLSSSGSFSGSLFSASMILLLKGLSRFGFGLSLSMSQMASFPGFADRLAAFRDTSLNARSE